MSTEESSMERSPSDLVRPLTTEGRADAASPAAAKPKAGERRPLALADRSEERIEDVREELLAVRAQLHSALERIRYQGVELAEARAQLEDERARYRELFEVAREGHIVTDLAGVIREFNHGAVTLLNLPPDYLRGKPVAAFVAVADRREFRIRLYRARTGATVQEWTTTVEHPDRPPGPVNVVLSPITDDAGAIQSLRFHLRDVSDARAGLVATRAPVAILRAALDALSAHIAVLDANGTIITVNRAWLGSKSPGGFLAEPAGAGENYLVLCERAIDNGNDAASAARDAVVSVLEGRRKRADVVYSVLRSSENQQSDNVDWFAMRVSRCDGPEPVHVVVTHEDVTAERQSMERERALLEERAGRAAAEAASQAKSEFLTTLSHELRTPLNAIAGYAQLLEMGVRGPVTLEQAEDLRRILRSERHLLGLINELLNFARLERGTVKLEIGHIVVQEVVTDVIELVEPQAASQRLTVTVACPDESMTALADAEKVRQILVNLLSNALKFTPRGGSIRIECDRNDENALVRIQDTGSGIPPSRLEDIFDPFVQVHRGYGSPADGIGLGLAISRNLARAMGGELTVSSEVGRGSCFELRLPRATTANGVT